MANAGATILDFGSALTDSASMTISDPNILGTSLVDAWVVPANTVDHSADEHWVENVKVMAGSVVDGVGFTIYGVATLGQTYGKFNVHWVWY